MQGYCNGCGKCCEAIRLGVSSAELKEIADKERAEGHETSDRIFIMEHWHEIPESEAFGINPFLQMQRDSEIVDGDRFYYTCDMYNTETKRCMAHESRPNICRGYPNYGKEYGTEYFSWYSPTCSYIDGAFPGERQLLIELVLEMEKRQVAAGVDTL